MSVRHVPETKAGPETRTGPEIKAGPETEAGQETKAGPAIPAVLEAMVVDANGIARGKWIPGDRIEEVLRAGVALPRSVFALDVWGCDVAEAGLAVGTGDPDGPCLPVPGSRVPVPWLERPTEQVLLRMLDTDGSPFFADPRQVLAAIVARFAARGLTPVVAAELEFYLTDTRRSAAVPVAPPQSHDSRFRGWDSQVLAIDELHAIEPVLAEIFAACEAQGVPADTAIREAGPGQYEVNLKHGADAVAAADAGFLLKRIVRGVARRHGMEATFMAKPYGDEPGSGMHVHCSLLDRDGHNVFAGGTEIAGTPLGHAVGGVLALLPATMLLLAPHANSYRRLCPGAHAPTAITWGIDNRMAAVRVIGPGGRAARLEHRVAGADCNIHLAVAGILAGVLWGIQTQAPCGPALVGEPRADAVALPLNWEAALTAFAGSAALGGMLGERYLALYAACKRQEQAEFRRRVPDVEYDAYLRVV